MTVILAIESSCDETSAAVSVNGIIKSNIVATQSVHENYGGVVPELASRAHQQHIIPVVSKALNEANIRKNKLDAVAFTQGPGLLGSLLVGASFAKSLALALNIRLIGIHHMQAHVLSHFIDQPVPGFPFICLTVSGGHTQLVKVSNYLEMEVIGETRDDAVGEAFDKCAKIMGFPYPGGPLIDQYAKQGDPKRFKFPSSDIAGLDYSFSGVKTAFLYFLRDELARDSEFIVSNLPDICASLQFSLVEMLIAKVSMAVKKTGIQTLAIAGGVSANSELRKSMTALGVENGWEVFIPKFEYCTDNAAMIAIAAHYKFQKKEFLSLDASPLPRMKM
ncbi:MAG: tRNA (adenosine(37)-N6)-threonylcarbamoyltransferase complex transferase subunit TsaD [Bacteroidetes bacterium]|nr:tRNA (adenosine(37)-N6)-threonylcarbamoyltransferase complex transferase subunit TsaD [Bacteroidota bacterium]MDA1121068.1 tRNA (adenosine(37)-N6)-threonylcarbamoyltransferase complex transferase subunit TsaD [Bacteroidota bacterium]